jgi:hypothetical protein
MPSQTIPLLGFWSAVPTFVSSITFIIGAAAGLPKALDIYIPVGASLLMALSSVVLMVTV